MGNRRRGGTGDAEAVRALIMRHSVDVNARSNGGRTALHVAAACGRLLMVQLLIEEFEATPNVRDNRQ